MNSDYLKNMSKNDLIKVVRLSVIEAETMRRMYATMQARWYFVLAVTAAGSATIGFAIACAVGLFVR